MDISTIFDKAQLTQHDLVRELFDYKDGKLYWRRKMNKRHSIDNPAGTVNSQGYTIITINGKKIGAHRLVWAWHNESVPAMIDHINRDTQDNRIENLRASDPVTNAYNSKIKCDNKSGTKGVSWCNTYNKWVVQMYANKKKFSGRFETKDEAIAFAQSMRKELHGDFACEGL
jgi:hypothetical protein